MAFDRHNPPYQVAGAVLIGVAVIAAGLVYLQFRGDLAAKAELTVVSARAGLVVERGAKVTYNGVEIGRVGRIGLIDDDGEPKAGLALDVDPRYLTLIPANVHADIRATTVFGNKYVSLSAPEDPSSRRISSSDVIPASAVTTEFNTLFETVVEIAQQVDPVKLNQTLSATAEALTGLGQRFGESLNDGNRILADLNPQLPQIRDDTRLLADLGEVYADAAPDLFDGLGDAATSAATFNAHRSELDAALMAALGFGDLGAVTFERSAPYLVRGAADLIPTSQLFDEYRGMLLCSIRTFNEMEQVVAKTLGGNGYSLATSSGTIAGGANPYVYPDNLPRVNARGGPEGRPGCWQKISRELWPAPYLVMDTGASIAPYNHLELGQPMYIEYVWGRQVGELTINP
ncbi:MCE family protein [Mycolicibacterium pulveris]|uniref:MCE family protein n=1 Tax=Mycolicibacterium pulveris TaxID=36813 RepID=UPI003CE6D0C9